MRAITLVVAVSLLWGPTAGAACDRGRFQFTYRELLLAMTAIAAGTAYVVKPYFDDAGKARSALRSIDQEFADLKDEEKERAIQETLDTSIETLGYLKVLKAAMHGSVLDNPRNNVALADVKNAIHGEKDKANGIEYTLLPKVPREIASYIEPDLKFRKVNAKIGEFTTIKLPLHTVSGALDKKHGLDLGEMYELWAEHPTIRGVGNGNYYFPGIEKLAAKAEKDPEVAKKVREFLLETIRKDVEVSETDEKRLYWRSDTLVNLRRELEDPAFILKR